MPVLPSVPVMQSVPSLPSYIANIKEYIQQTKEYLSELKHRVKETSLISSHPPQGASDQKTVGSNSSINETIPKDTDLVPTDDESEDDNDSFKSAIYDEDIAKSYHRTSDVKDLISNLTTLQRRKSLEVSTEEEEEEGEGLLKVLETPTVTTRIGII